MKSLILAGGSGSRLWPLSREQFPKQFIKLGEKSLFQDTFIRCLELSDVSEVFVVTNEFQKYFVIGQIQEMGYDIPIKNVLIEPQSKDTLPAICYGMKEIHDKYGHSNVAIFPSDHILEHSATSIIKSVEPLASSFLIVFGITPTSPHTGYGYIHAGEPINRGYKVNKFVEKPTHDIAIQYINDGFLWNSGIFLFNTKLYFDELKTHQEDTFDLFINKNVANVFQQVPKISIDKGILEKSYNLAVIKLNTKWSDMGDFTAIYNNSTKDNDNNVIFDCDSLNLDSTNNLIYSQQNKMVSLIGINGLSVVDTPDALLICPQSDSQRVKDLVFDLKSKHDERIKSGLTVYRPWGYYSILEKSPNMVIKKITVLPDSKLSSQLHYHRSEHWVVVKGIAQVQINNDEFFVRRGESTFIKIGDTHRLTNPGKIPLELIEVQLGEYISENDIVRFDDEYGR